MPITTIIDKITHNGKRVKFDEICIHSFILVWDSFIVGIFVVFFMPFIVGRFIIVKC